MFVFNLTSKAHKNMTVLFLLCLSVVPEHFSILWLVQHYNFQESIDCHIINYYNDS